MKTEIKYRKDIQALRGLAVLAVVLFHAKESYFPLGYLGVDVFFVISGFVVTPLILRIFNIKTSGSGLLSNLKYFYRRRFYRLAPALALTLSISAITIFLIGPVVDHQKFARQGIATLLLSGNIGAYRYSGDYFSPNPNPLVHTWSLSVEEQIYIFLPLLLVLILHNRSNIKKLTTIVLISITGLSFTSFLFPELLRPLYSLIGIQLPSLFSFYSAVDRIWQFTLGGVGFLFLNRFKSETRHVPRFINLLATFAVLVILFGPVLIEIKVGSVIATFLSLIVILLNSLEALPNFIASKLKWLGDRSYSIYLVHMPLLYIAKYSPWARIGDNENRVIQSILAVIASISLGALSYSKIENRYRNQDKNIFLKAKSIATTLVVTVVVPLVLFVGVDHSNALWAGKSGLPVPDRVLPWNWDEKCQFYSPQPDVNSKPCKYGDHNSGKSIFLIGDSHAASDSRSIIKLGNLNDMDTFVFTFQGCGFVLSKTELNPSFAYPYLTDDCIKHNKSILEFAKSKRPTVIILTHRSSSIMVSPNNKISRSQYNQMIAKNLKVLREVNIPIINIGSEPELLPGNTWLHFLLKKNVAYSQVPFEDRLFWGESNSTNYYLDSLKIFCPNDKCRNKSDEGWLFQDADHLSERGADLLLPNLDIILKEILKGKV